MHLADCPLCRDSLTRIKGELEFMGSIRLGTNQHRIPAPARRSFSSALVRSAALIIFGIMVGFGLARLSRPEPVFVVPDYDRPAASAITEYGQTASEATAVRFRPEGIRD